MGKLASTLGEQPTIVVVATFNGGTPDPALVESARQMFFGPDYPSMDHFYRNASNGQIWFIGPTVGVSVPVNLDCTHLEIALAGIDAAVAAKGYNLDDYTRRAYVGLSCLSSDFSSYGGINYSAIYLRGVGGMHHEMGHSLWLSHAGWYNPPSARGDNYDHMGSSYWGGFNAPHKEQLGWWKPEQIVTAPSGGVFTITHHIRSWDGLKLVKIPKSDTGEFYYISYQQEVPSHILATYPWLNGGASLHVYKPIIDPYDPGLTAMDFITKYIHTGTMPSIDDPLVDGRVWYDSVNRISIKQLSHTDLEVVVEIKVNIDPAPPPQPPPQPVTIILAPSSSSLRANQQQQFTTNSTKSITWSISPQVGNITQSGLYKSPSRIKGQRTIVVAATDGASSGSAVVTLVK